MINIRVVLFNVDLKAVPGAFGVITQVLLHLSCCCVYSFTFYATICVFRENRTPDWLKYIHHCVVNYTVWVVWEAIYVSLLRFVNFECVVRACLKCSGLQLLMQLEDVLLSVFVVFHNAV